MPKGTERERRFPANRGFHETGGPKRVARFVFFAGSATPGTPEWHKSSTVVHVLVSALSCAALAAGADGLLVEVHPNSPEEWCDADQALTPTEFVALMDKLEAVAQAVGRTLDGPRTRLSATCA